MASATSKLEILIDARNNASAGLKQVSADVQGLDKAAGKAAAGLEGLLGAAGIAGIGALAMGVANTAMELTNLANESERVEQAFERLAGQAGQSADEMLAAMKEASRGTIDSTELMVDANKAMLLGVADSGEELGNLLKIAGERAKAMGTDTASAFSDIVTAIGRQSVMIADNLGITLSLEEAYARYAGELGLTADKLTDAQKKQAFLNEVMRQSKSDLEAAEQATNDTTQSITTMTVAWKEFRTELGKEIAPAVNEAAQDIGGLMGWLQKNILGDENDVIRQISTYELAIERLRQQIADPMTQDAQRTVLIEELKFATAALADLTGASQRAKFETGEVEAAFHRVAPAATVAAGSFTSMELKAANLAAQLAQLKAQSDATSAALSGIANAAIGAVHAAASAAVGIMPASEIARIYGENTKRIEEQVKVMHDVGMSQDEIDFKTQEMAKKASLPFDIAVDAAREAEKANNHVAKSVDALSQEYSNLESKVSSVLQSALDPGVGVDPDALLEAMGLPREDAINENARRLADIAKNGLKGQDWLDEFQKEVPDIWQMIRLAQNPQEEAARLLKDFQDGLITSPIDKGKAKEIVRRAILGEQNMAALATEIATELAGEMGIPLQKAMEATQSTLGGGGGMGTTAAQSFAEGAATGMEEANGGGAMVDSFIAQMKARYSSLADAGKEAARAWSTAFVGYVGDTGVPQLVDVLANLVTPAVQARLAQQGTLTAPVP